LRGGVIVKKPGGKQYQLVDRGGEPGKAGRWGEKGDVVGGEAVAETSEKGRKKPSNQRSQ